ncbi:unnamed protein product [Adineta steineri]|uniref:Uncharacterized protein n=2 Tax=Adineta steineri TaxID=433720 RepID=A0A818IA33_9BILA|nr:unnamed protein product [Adineta steineri]CAF0746017.1 unnamed protein product [Adineta steineri]CAF3488222.1 unnamed protein product [Adineta steineri]CAF3521505.1 unnamed protein product [Adineta steineri]
MTQSRRKNLSAPKANKLHHCSKVKCHRSLPLNHPISYTNGLCERHFFLIDLPSIDDNNNDNINNSYLSNESKEKQIQQTKNQYEPLRGDTRIIREVFDGCQWHMYEDRIDHETSKISQMIDSNLGTKSSNINNETLLQIFHLVSSYKTILDELKEKHSK